MVTDSDLRNIPNRLAFIREQYGIPSGKHILWSKRNKQLFRMVKPPAPNSRQFSRAHRQARKQHVIAMPVAFSQSPALRHNTL